MTSVESHWNLLQELISLKIKQSKFKMMYGHVSSFEISIKVPLYLSLSLKKYIFQKYPKQGSSTCWNSVHNTYQKLLEKDQSKKECIKSSQVRTKEKKFKRKMCVINFKWGWFANKRCYHKNRKKKKEKKKMISTRTGTFLTTLDWWSLL